MSNLIEKSLEVDGEVSFDTVMGCEYVVDVRGELDSGTLSIRHGDTEYPEGSLTEAGGGVYWGCAEPITCVLSGAGELATVKIRLRKVC